MTLEQVEFRKFALSEGDRYALNDVDGDTLQATNSLNCRCVDDKIRIGLGLTYIKNAYGRNVTVNETVKNVIPASYLQDNMERQCPLVIGTDGRFYQYDESLEKMTALSVIIGGNVGVCFAPAANGNSGAFVVSSQGFVQTGNQRNILQEVSGMASGGVCVFEDRVFYSMGNTVIFSDAGDYQDFTETAYGGGKIEVWQEAGRVWQLLPYDGAILMFKERCVFRMFASGAADAFKIEKLDFGGGKIARGSAAVCGKYVMFITEDGYVYRFNGSSFEKIAAGVPKEYCNDFRATASDGSRYFRGGDEFTLVMETDGSSYESYSVEGLTGCDGVAAGVYDKKLCRFDPMGSLPQGESSIFEVDPLVLKDEKEKIVRKVVVYGTGIVGVALNGERGNMNRSVVLGANGVALDAEVRGKTFGLKIDLSGNGRIDKIVFAYTLVE